MQPIELTVAGQTISARLFKPRESINQAVLFLHGWQSNQDSPRQFAEALCNQGFTCLTFDFRGMGLSQGDIHQLTRDDFLQDCLAAYDRLASQGKFDQFHVVGSSFGSYMTAILSAHRPMSSLVLRVPANYPDNGFDELPQLLLSSRVETEKWEAQK